MKNLPLLLLGLICSVSAITVSAQTPEQASNFQINATHTGAITIENFAPPLKPRWTVNFGQPISYPLIADGRVFVTVRNPTLSTGTTLYALDATNGATIWSFNLGGGAALGAACYENGRVFALNYAGLLRSFDAATGNVVMSVDLPGTSGYSAPPAVLNGVVYISAGLNVRAVNAVTGAILWSASVINGDNSSPAVTNDGVYVSYACPNVYKLNPANGAKIWHYAPGCSGGGGRTPVLHNGRLYVRDSFDTIFDSQTGTIIGNFNAKNSPVFSGDKGFFLDGPHGFGSFGTLVARDVNTNSILWSFADGFLQSAVLVVNNYVYVGSSQGNLYAVDAATGQQVWMTNTGESIPYVDEHNASQPVTSFAAAEGLLVIPTSTKLIAYERQDTTAPTLTFGNPTPAPNAAGWNNTAVDISFTTADDLSGVQSSNPASPLHFTSEGANQTQQVTVTDNANNSATFTSPAVNIDFTQPATLASISGTSQNQQWFTGAVTVTLSATDNLSGVANSFYRIDGGAMQTYASPFSITSNGNHLVEYWSVDVAGNMETHQTQIVRIDATAPLVTASANPSTAPKKPHSVTVTISGSITDSVSGISSASFNVIDEYGAAQPSGSVTVQANGTYSFTLSLPATKQGWDKDGHLYTIVVRGTDQAGNSTTATTTLRIN